MLKRLGPSGLRVGGDDLADVLERAYAEFAKSGRTAMTELEQEVDAVAEETGFSGVVRVDRGGQTELAKAYGLAHRGFEIPNTIETRFATASGTKTLTALAVVSLIEAGSLELSTTARSVLGDDLPLIADDVTVEHLLAHRSGIGDYLDEEGDLDFADYLMPVPVHELVKTEDYLAVLGGFPTKFPAGERFSYCNGGYVVLALIAERASGVSYHELVRTRVCEPAGMRDTEFLRSDELPGRAALGYLEVDGAADERLPSPRPRHRRRRDLHDRRGRQLALARVLRRLRSSRRTGSPRWCARAARRRRSPGGTASGSGSIRPATR